MGEKKFHMEQKDSLVRTQMVVYSSLEIKYVKKLVNSDASFVL
jgi:hypothetical protein